MKKPTTIILAFIILVCAGVACFQLKSTGGKEEEKGGYLTYTNEKFGYSVDYPPDWTFREFPDTKDGAGFRPMNSPDDVSSECVSVAERGTADGGYGAMFSDYVRKAAVIEIQNYLRLNSISPIGTESGIIGYKTTWDYRLFGGEEKVSLPITYFENEKEKGGLKYKTVQISLNDESCEEAYGQMLPTFRILD